MVAKTLDSLEERPAGRRRQDRLCRDSPKWFCRDMGQLGRVTESWWKWQNSSKSADQMKIYQNIYKLDLYLKS